MRRFIIISCCIFCCFLAGCASERLPESHGGMEIYFCHLSDCDDVFEGIISSSEKASCAFYDIDDERIINALQEKRAKLVIDEESSAVGFAKIRRGNGIMHQKTCVLDGRTIITGSYNPVDGSERDYNNVLVIHSPILAEHYGASIEGIIAQRRNPSKHTLFLHDGKLIEAYACPQDDCREKIIRTLASAEHNISFALFTFTDKEVADQLLEANARGLSLRGVIESFQSSSYSQHGRLLAAGVDVVLERSSRLQHNKFFIIDDEVVITGSYNPTNAAATVNDEALIIIHDPRVARIYQEQFQAIYDETQSFK